MMRPQIPLSFEMFEAKDGRLYINVEDMLDVLRYYQSNLYEFEQTDFTLVKQVKKEELN